MITQPLESLSRQIWFTEECSRVCSFPFMWRGGCDFAPHSLYHHLDCLMISRLQRSLRHGSLNPIRSLASYNLAKLLKHSPSPNTAKPEWHKRDAAIKKRYGKWNPTRKLTRDQMDDVKHIAAQMPHLRTVDLAQYFQVLPEAIRRILKSKWQPSEQTELALREREQRRKQERKARNPVNGVEQQPLSVHIEDLMAALETKAHNSTPPSTRKPRKQHRNKASDGGKILFPGDYID